MRVKDRRMSDISNKNKNNVCNAESKVWVELSFHRILSKIKTRSVDIIELKKTPSKTVINDDLNRIQISYLKKLNVKLTEPIKKRHI